MSRLLFQRSGGCFRSLLLVGCPHLLLTKALVPDLKRTTIGEVKFTPKGFQSNALQYFYQQLMAEAPSTTLSKSLLKNSLEKN